MKKDFLSFYRIGRNNLAYTELVSTPLLELKTRDYVSVHLLLSNKLCIGIRGCKILTRTILNRLFNSVPVYVRRNNPSLLSIWESSRDFSASVELIQIDPNDFIPFLSTWLVMNERRLADHNVIGFTDYIELMKKYYGV